MGFGQGPEYHGIRANSSKFLDFSGAGVETTGDGQVWVKFIEFHDFEVILPDSLSGSEIGHFQICPTVPQNTPQNLPI